MMKIVGATTKQRIREAVWNAMLQISRNTNLKFMDTILTNLHKCYQYKQSYIHKTPKGKPTYIFIKNKCIIDVTENMLAASSVHQYMEESNLPGVQVSLESEKESLIQWNLIDQGIFMEDGDIEQIIDDPASHRNFELDDLTKNILVNSFKLPNTKSSNDDKIDTIYHDLRSYFSQCFKEIHINSFMPDITILEVCVIDINNRNRGLILAPDVKQSRSYINDLLMPAVLVNYATDKLSSIAWFSCKESKIELAVEFFRYDSTVVPNLELDDETKYFIKDTVEQVRNIPKMKTERDLQEAFYKVVEEKYGERAHLNREQVDRNTFNDIIIDDLCVIDIRRRSSGILMSKDQDHLTSKITTTTIPGVQISFINDNSEAILWFGCKHGNAYIELEAIGKDPNGVSLIDLFK